MKPLFSDANDPICVAVAFDEHAPNLIRSAESLAERLNSPLLLVHVTEPWVGAAGMGILPVPEISDRIQQELITKAKRQLEELAERVKNVHVTIDVRLGIVADEVIASASQHNAKVIFAGHASREHSFIPKGFSSALGIMGNSRIPVIVISENRPADFSKANLSIMIADDLSNDGKLVLSGGYEFATKVGARVEHVHANGVSKDSLKAALALATSASKGTPDAAISEDEYLQALKQIILKRMEKRLDEAKASLALNDQSGIKINQSVIDGNPDEAIAEMVEETNPELLAFGRHHTFYRKPFLIGRVPFKAMLKMPTPGLLIIPPEATDG